MIEDKEPSMIVFLAQKMMESDPNITEFQAMATLMFAILWTHEKKFILIHDLRSEHSRILERSLAVSLPAPRPSQVGAWVTMICDGAVDAVQFANAEFVEWVRESMGRRSILDV